jgi:hypothetical protein
MDHNAPIYASHIDNKHVPPGPAFIGWCRVSFFSLFIYSYVHTLFGPFLPPAPHPIPIPSTPSHFQAEPVLPFSPMLLKNSMSNNKKGKTFFASWDKNSYTERFVELLPCTSVLQPKLIHLDLTSSPLPSHLPILTFVVLRLLY